MLPVATDVATNSCTTSSVRPGPTRRSYSTTRPENPVLRGRFVAFLRASAQRRERLADRLEPRSGPARIALGR